MREEASRAERRALDRKLTRVAWAAFLVMWGITLGIGVSSHADLRSLQYASVGLILLGLNGARYLRGIPMSRLTLVIGILALAGGLLRQLTGEISLLPIVAITVGSVILVEGVMMGQGDATRTGRN